MDALIPLIFLVLLFGFIGSAIVSGINLGKNYNRHSAETKQRLDSKYKIDEFYMELMDWSFVAISFDAHKIILGTKDHEDEYDFRQIASVEVVQNGATVTQTNRGSQLLGAAVGGLTFGALGAAVGGLSGSSRSQGRLQGLSIKVTVDDRLRPSHMICFLRSANKKGVDPNSTALLQLRERVDGIHAHLLNAMRQAQVVTPVASAADELQKLWDMKQAGILTEDEFAGEKRRLLGQSRQPQETGAELTILPQPPTTP